MTRKICRIHQFDPVLYPFKIWIVITTDLRTIAERFIDHPSGKDFGTDAENMIAFTQKVKQKSDGFVGAIIVFKKHSDCITKHIAHESTHAARLLWSYIGEENTGTEADAYLVGWIAECCENVRLNKF